MGTQDTTPAGNAAALQPKRSYWSSRLRNIPKKFKIGRQFFLAEYLGGKIIVEAEDHDIDLKGRQWVAPDLFEPHAKRLTALFNSMVHPRAYELWQDMNRRELIAALAAREDFRKAALAWPSLGKEREALVLEVTRLHHQIYGSHLYAPPTMDFDFYSDPALGLEDERYIRGSFLDTRNPETHERLWRFRYNTHADTGFQNFLLAMNFVHHENTHAVQDAFKALHNAGLVANHPLHETALYWHESKVHRYAYFSNVRPFYYNHPLEKDSFRQGDMFASELRAALAKEGIVVPPQPPFP